MPKLKPLTLKHDEYVYHEGEYSDSMYFICHGSVNFVLNREEIVYKTYLRGSFIGEIELIKGIAREDNAQAAGRTEMLALEKVNFWEMMEEFPNEAKNIKSQAFLRRRNNKLAFLNTRELLKLKQRRGTLAGLIGKQQILIPTEELDMEEEDFDTRCEVDRVDNLRNAIEEVKRDLATAAVLMQRNSAGVSLVRKRIEEKKRRNKEVQLPFS